MTRTLSRHTKLALCLAACAAAFGCGGDGADSQNRPANSAAANAPAAANAGAPAAAGPPAAQTPAAQTVSHPEAGLQFDVPAGWKTDEEGEQYRLVSADGDISVTFWVPVEGDFENAAKAIGEEIGKQLTDLKYDAEPRQDKHNGMDHISVTGSGKAEGRSVNFSADMLRAKKPVIILTFSSPENFRHHEAEYSKFVSSIKRAG
jgi:hypothetical protein